MEWEAKNPGNSNAKVNLKSAREVLRVEHPQFNHNGGELRFGSDNMLYISIGDGGSADDQGPGHTTPGGNAQDLSNLLGKILRIDPVTGTKTPGYNIPTDNPFVGRLNARGEIWAYGFRNPYKMSFDKETGLLYVGDVGQNDVEEVDIVFKGKNYGWPLKEGSFAFDQNGTARGFVTDVPVRGDFVDPIAQFDHCIPPINLAGPCAQKEGLAIVGGFVYRGNEIKELRGRYVFGSYASDSGSTGRLFYMDSQNQVKEFNLSGSSALGLSLLGIGQDGRGELYVLGKSGAITGNTGITDPANSSGVVRKLVAVKTARGGGGSGKPGKPKPNPGAPGY
ncbi:MAG: PQQ-dependent sugar dehydrogenase [Gammaproteobacteria bacterium]|nr:PQQ-dependent sugar dehydrogenase [Gammaproteobacteria bacterium]